MESTVIPRDKKGISLKVQDPDPTHVGRNIVTLDRKTKEELGITSGDLIEIQGTKKTAAVVWPARSEDEGKGIIRMDNLIRHNAGAGLGEKVVVRKAEFKEAKKVVLAPTQEIRIIASGYDRILKKTFIGRPLTKGDKVWISVFGSGFIYVVVDTSPRGIVKVSDFTQFVLKEEPVKEALEGAPKVAYEDIGGMEEQVKKVREMVELPMRHPELFRKLGISPPKGVLLHGPPGCLTGEALVALEDGRLVRMEEVAKNLLPGIYVADLPVYPPAHAKAVHVYDVPETIEIVLQSGKRLRLTPNHPLMTRQGWMEAGKLNVGDSVKTFNWVPSPTALQPTLFAPSEKRVRGSCKIPTVWDEKLAKLAGIFVAEGNVEKWRIKFAIHSHEKEFRDVIDELMQEKFGVRLVEFVEKEKKCRKMRYSHRFLEDFFKILWSLQKKIPSPILLSPNAVASAFLQGLFEGDGSVVAQSPKYDRCITLKSASRQLLEEVQTLLLRWSILSNLYEYKTKGGKDERVLKISGRSNLEKFNQNIRFISSRKQEKLDRLLKSYKRPTTNERKWREFEPVKSAKRILEWQRVYDFEVPTTHSFFTNGILSHNTGKTLLAKAVANETQAHFISISGPEIMCVSGDTPILTNPKGGVKAKELFDEGKRDGKVVERGFAEVVELQTPKTVYSLDDHLKVVKGKITHAAKLKAATREIMLDTRESFSVSSNHPFLTLDSLGQIQWKKASDVRKEEWVASARNLPEGSPAKFDWTKKFDPKTTFVQISGKTVKLGNAPKEKAQNALVKTSKTKSNIERANWVKLPLQSTPELTRFLGLLYAEGTVDGETVWFANREKALREEFKKLSQSQFGISHFGETSDRVEFYSTTVAHYLHEVLGFPKGAKKEYSLPEWIFGVSKKETVEFLTGFWEGDGTVSKGTGGYPTLRYYASAKNVLKNLSVLCRKVGWTTQIVPWKTKLSNMWALVLTGTKSRESFAQNVQSSARKFKSVQKWAASKRIRTGDDMPLPDISKLLQLAKKNAKLRYGKELPEKPSERYISGRNLLTFRKLKEILQWIPKGSEKSRLQMLLDADVCWTRVESNTEGNEQELYDFTVEPYHNFLAGHSLAVMHNSKYVGEAEERVRQIFKEAEENAPSIIFIDEIDSIAPKREEVVGEVERRVVAQLLALMDGMEGRGNVIVIAATNRVNSIDEALRRPGRFDREIEIGVPDVKGRKVILQIHSRGMPLAKDFSVDQLAQITHGFVGADLAALVKEAAMKALSRYLPEINLEEETIPPEVLEKLEVNKEDFLDALKEVQPSALREVMVEVPNTKWTDIGSLEEVKAELRQAIEWPLKFPDSFKKMGISPPKGVLLYGPPGCGKTLLARAIATESEANFISIKGPELISKWVGESERGIRKIFKKARQVSPVIIFFDEIDSIASLRGSTGDSGVGERVVNQLLTELDGVESNRNVVFVAATNRPDLIDPGMMRPGRIDKVIMVGAPDRDAREQIFKIHTKGVPIAKNVSIKELAERTEGFSGADIQGLVREAALAVLSENKMKEGDVQWKHFEEAFNKVLPSIPKETNESYEDFRKKLANVKLSYVG
ncbi:MAG: AAA family ATPase [Candidatus Diapherotrites archaeon]